MMMKLVELLLGLAGEVLLGALVVFFGNWVAISELIEDPVELFYGFLGGIIRSVACGMMAQSGRIMLGCLDANFRFYKRLYLELFMRFGWRDWRLNRVHLLTYRRLRRVSRHRRSRLCMELLLFHGFRSPLVLGARNAIWLQSLIGRWVLLSDLGEDLRCRVIGSIEHHLAGLYCYLLENIL